MDGRDIQDCSFLLAATVATKSQHYDLWCEFLKCGKSRKGIGERWGALDESAACTTARLARSETLISFATAQRGSMRFPENYFLYR